MRDRAADDRACVADLYARWSGAIHSYASRLLGSSAAADDVTPQCWC